jgi:hypothetical protein
VRAVLLVAKAEARRRGAALLGLALIVGLVGTAVLASVAGARRSDSALDRYREATAARDGRAFALTLGAPVNEDVVAAVAAVDGVAEAGGAGIHPTDALFDIDVTVLTPFDDVAYQRIDQPLVLDGRLPDPDAPDEVVLSELAVDRLDLHTRDRLEVGTFSLQDCAALADDDFQGFNGPALDLEVVGEVRVIEELQGSDLESGPVAIASPALNDTLGSDACAVGVVVPVRYSDGPGPTSAAMTAALRSAAPDAREFQAGSIEEEFLDGVRSAINVAVVALIAFALVTAAAGLLAVVQAVIRQVDGAGEVGKTLGAVGLTRSQRATAVALPLVAAGAVGTVLAVSGAVALSPRFPLGVARQAEPDPGVAFDGLALGVGALALLLLVAATGYVAARRLAGRGEERSQVSVVAATAARAGAAPSVVVGLRLAGDRGRGRTAVRTAMVGTGLAVAGLCAVAVLAGSLTAVLDQPERYGWAWSSKPDLDSEDPPATVEAITGEDDVAAVGVLRQASLDLDGEGVDGFALEVNKGSMAGPVLEGRLPGAATEIALGAQVLEDIDIGGTVTATAPDGAPVELTVVGRVVTPQIDSTGSTGVVLAPEGMADLAPEAERSLVLTYAPDADVDRLEAHLEEAYGVSFPAYARPNPPGRLVHLDELRGLLAALAAFFVLLGLAGLAHALAVTGRRHRGFFATLRALGFERRQVRRSVVTASTAIVVVSILVGVPLGVVAGRVVWQLQVGDLGILDSPTVPAGVVALVVALTVVAAVVVAVLPAWRAGRRPPAAVLRAE